MADELWNEDDSVLDRVSKTRFQCLPTMLHCLTVYRHWVYLRSLLNLGFWGSGVLRFCVINVGLLA
jgi:hypothetical protein